MSEKESSSNSIQHGSGAVYTSINSEGRAVFDGSAEHAKTLPKLTEESNQAGFDRWKYFLMSTLNRIGLAKYITDDSIYHSDVKDGREKPIYEILTGTMLLQHDKTFEILLATVSKSIQDKEIDLIRGVKASFDNICRQYRKEKPLKGLLKQLSEFTLDGSETVTAATSNFYGIFRELEARKVSFPYEIQNILLLNSLSGPYEVIANELLADESKDRSTKFIMEKLNALEDLTKSKAANEIYINSVQTKKNKNYSEKRIFKCYNCRRRGHSASICRLPKQCLNCKSKEHYLHECKEKKRYQNRNTNSQHKNKEESEVDTDNEGIFNINMVNYDNNEVVLDTGASYTLVNIKFKDYIHDLKYITDESTENLPRLVSASGHNIEKLGRGFIKIKLDKVITVPVIVSRDCPNLVSTRFLKQLGYCMHERNQETDLLMNSEGVNVAHIYKSSLSGAMILNIKRVLKQEDWNISSIHQKYGHLNKHLLLKSKNLPESGKVWKATIKDFLLNNGYVELDNIFIRETDGNLHLALGLYVDDIAIVYKSKFYLKELMDLLNKNEFKLKWKLDGIEKLLGLEMKLTKNNENLRCLLMKKEGAIKEIGSELDLGDETNNKITKALILYKANNFIRKEELTMTKLNFDYRRVLGMIMYISNSYRYDITYICNYISRYTEYECKETSEMLIQLGRYLTNTKEFGLKIKKSLKFIAGLARIDFYIDADHANDRDDRYSTSGALMLLNNNIIYYHSKLMRIDVKSSSESELCSLDLSMDKLDRLKTNILGLFKKVEIKIYEDNMPVIHWITGIKNYKMRTKTLDNKLKVLRRRFNKESKSKDEVDSWNENLIKIDGKLNLSDYLTKPIPKGEFLSLRDKLNNSL